MKSYQSRISSELLQSLKHIPWISFNAISMFQTIFYALISLYSIFEEEEGEKKPFEPSVENIIEFHVQYDIQFQKYLSNCIYLNFGN